MKTSIIFAVLLFTIILSFLPYYFYYIPGVENKVQYAAWGFVLLSVLIAIYFLAVHIRSGRYSQKQIKKYYIIVLSAMLLFLGFNFTMFSFSAGVEAMWPTQAPVKIPLPDLNEELYVYSSSNFPDAGENIEIRRRNGWLPVMETIFSERDFDYAGFKKETGKLILLSGSGKKLVYSFQSHKVESE